MRDQKLANVLGALAWALADAQAAAMREASGLGVTVCAALVTIGIAPGLTIGRIARTAGVSHSVMVRLVDDLAGRGLVGRAPGADRREVTLTLTRAGERARAGILAARAAVADRALACLPAPDRARLAGVIGRLLDHLTTGRDQADRLCRVCDEAACPDCPVEARARFLEGSGA